MAGDAEATVSVAAIDAAPVRAYRFECSADNGATWPAAADSSTGAATVVGPLVNGTEHVCRAFAGNERGTSPASLFSDPFRPCGSLVECNPALLPAAGALLALVLILLVVALLAWWRSRTRAWVSATVDDFDPVNLGRGPSVGLNFVRDASGGAIQHVVRGSGSRSDVGITYRGGDRFAIKTAGFAAEARSGDALENPGRTG